MTNNLSIRTSFGLVLMLLVAVPAWAQHGFRGGGVHGGGSLGHGGGFGGGFVGGRIGGIHGGFAGGHFGGFRGGFAGFGHRGFSYRPFYWGFYGYPGYGSYTSFGYGHWPSYYYWGPSYGYYAPSYPIVIESDVVRYRQPDRDYDREVVRSVSAERYWLVAFQDTTIVAVTDYWLEGSTLNYVTRQGTKSSTDVSNVDLQFTKQLNHERGVEFQLSRSSGVHQSRRLDSYGRPY